MSHFIEGEYKVRVDGTSMGRGPVIYVPNYWNDGKDDWEFCEFESTEVRESRARNPKAKWKPTENHDELMATAVLFAASPKLLEACEMALDSLTMSAQAYEEKYYPYAGPLNLTDAIKSAIELATDTTAPIEKFVGGRPERDD